MRIDAIFGALIFQRALGEAYIRGWAS